jgi:glyoxylase-like metal-dependent hydrolase (beta-lactamase superfamily II)
MKLTENLYAYIWKGNDNNCNSYIFAEVLTGNKHIIIDPGYIVTPHFKEPAFEILTKGIKEDGLKVEDIGMVIITHAHPDHLEAARNSRKIILFSWPCTKMRNEYIKCLGEGM